MERHPPKSPLFPYTTLFRSQRHRRRLRPARLSRNRLRRDPARLRARLYLSEIQSESDRKSTRLNSSHVSISYAVFCLKKKKLYRNGAAAAPEGLGLMHLRLSLPYSIIVLIINITCTKSYINIFFLNGTPPPEISTLSLHDALPISTAPPAPSPRTS